MEEPDPQVIAAARRGDIGAFEELVRQYQAHVWRFIFGVMRDGPISDDVSQETFVKAFRSMKRFKGEAKFSTWLFSIARNCATDELRRGQRRRRLLEKAASQPVQETKQLDSTADLREVIGQLPKELREVVVLVDMLGFRYREAAEVCGVALGTVKSRLHFARLAIGDAIAPEELSDEG